MIKFDNRSSITSDFGPEWPYIKSHNYKIYLISERELRRIFLFAVTRESLNFFEESFTIKKDENCLFELIPVKEELGKNCKLTKL